MGTPFSLVAYYTVNTPYEKEINNLKESCEKFNIPLYTRGYKSRGSWVENCAIKSEFIQDCLEKFDNTIIYLDSDAVIVKEPILFSNFVDDIAVYYTPFKELVSATLFFSNNSKTKLLVDLWVRAQHNNPSEWDQKVLQSTIEYYKDSIGLRIVQLPTEYCKIFDKFKSCKDPVITQNQASRRFKDLI